MKINKSKSSLYGINYDAEELGRLAVNWGCEVGNWPMVYLGLPLGGNPRAKCFWTPVIEKVEKRLQSWKRACLSKGGRMTLIQSVLYCLPSYFMSLFKMPVGVATKIERLIRNFLWGGEGIGRGRSLVRWEVVGQTKEDGGLGFGFLRERNEALRAKWLWRFPLEPNSLWHRVIKSKYGVEDNGWDTKLPRNASSRNPWKDISSGYQTFWKCCRFRVGDGQRIRFWEDYWLRDGVLSNLFPRLFALSTKKNSLVAGFVTRDEGNLGWDFGFRRNMSEAEIGEVARLVEMLGRVNVCNSTRDRRGWEIEDNGIFSCKSFRSFLTGNGRRERFPPFEGIWKAKSPPKVKFFVWVAAMGRANTLDMVQRRNPRMSLSPNWCVMCKESEETEDHLFLQCTYALSVWWKLLKEVGVSWVIPKGCCQLLSYKMGGKGNRKRSQVLTKCLVQAILWSIWLERNNRIFQEHRGVSADELWERAKFWAAMWAAVSGHFEDYHYSVILRDLGAVLC